ncbi:MAG: AmmeMemoRadiSam system protein A [Bacteroidales bacterium]
MPESNSIFVQIARLTIKHHLEHGHLNDLKFQDAPEILTGERRGCFVSLHLKDGSLRGCIGTIEPVEKNLLNEIKRNALSAAFRDSRFEPLREDEFGDLEISVDVLSVPEQIESPNDLDPAIYGVIVSDGSYHRAVLLPFIEGIDTVEKQLNVVKRKAGLERKSWDELTIFRFTTKRYH